MKISIVTPSFNQGRYIEETIQSFLRQGYPDLELIIIDGGSSDESVEVIRKYEQYLAYWVSEPDNGQSHAINKGLKIATGDIVTWINSDDLLTDGTLNTVAALFSETSEDIGVIHGGTIRFNDRGVIDRDFGYDDPSPERYLSGMAFPQPSAFFRRSLLTEVGYLDENLHYGMDYDLFARMSMVCKFKRVLELFSKYRIHAASKTVAGDDRFIEDWTRTFVRVAITINNRQLLDELGQLRVFDRVLAETGNGYDVDLTISRYDSDLMMFYFLSYVFKSDYRNSRFDRAKAISRYLTKKYANFIATDQELYKTIQRLEMLPEIVIRLLRRVKAVAA